MEPNEGNKYQHRLRLCSNELQRFVINNGGASITVFKRENQRLYRQYFSGMCMKLIQDSNRTCNFVLRRNQFILIPRRESRIPSRYNDNSIILPISAEGKQAQMPFDI